jgi:uncharacterized protein YdeI (YjbR/CyaY-like superfamily)
MSGAPKRTNKSALVPSAKGVKKIAAVHFDSPAAWRRWLASNHDSASEVTLRLMRKHAVDRGIGYSAALDDALCYGWIDGVRRAYDADSFTTRFTPRRPLSNWSNVNVAHVQRLLAAGRMTAPGRAAFAARSPQRQGVYSFERAQTELAPALAMRLRANRKAQKFFTAQPPGYRRGCAHWVMSAKLPATRDKRLAQLIADSAAGLRIAPLRR